MELKPVLRRQQKIRLALMGRSGSGKTMSALLLAYGLCGDWHKIAFIDTEGGSASLYSHLGPFNTLQIGPPYHVSRYYEAIDLIEDSGKEVIIVDSLSPEWKGDGGVMDRLDRCGWEEALREHRALLSLIQTCSCHIICTLRTKQKLVRRGEKSSPYWQLLEIPVQQEGIEYPFTTVLRLDGRQAAHVVKDRTGIFSGKEPARLELDHGLFLSNWSKLGEPVVPDELQSRIDACGSVEELQQLLFKAEIQDVEAIGAFTRRRLQLEQWDEEPPRPAA